MSQDDFFDGLEKDIDLLTAVELSKSGGGKPDAAKAAGIAAGLGNTSLDDTLMLGAILGAEGAFDDDTDDGASSVGLPGFTAVPHTSARPPVSQTGSKTASAPAGSKSFSAAAGGKTAPAAGHSAVEPGSPAAEAIETCRRRAKKRKTCLAVCVLAIVLTVIAVLTAKAIIKAQREREETEHYAELYDQAIALVGQKKYTDAVILLEDVYYNGYKGTKDLYYYCLGEMYYESGKRDDAYFYTSGIDCDQFPEDLRASMKADVEQFSRAYFRGTTIYHYTTRSQSTTAAAYTTQITTAAYTTRGAAAYAPYDAGADNQPGPAATTAYDPYNANDYADADDFYYDHYDDFIDEEDAEEYYDAYGD